MIGPMSTNNDTQQPDIEIEPPFLSRFQCGNTGIDYLHSVDSGIPGPHAMITSVVHGNEFSGAIAVAELIDNPPKLERGRLSLCFVNADACSQFDRLRPWHTRFIDEDMNRVWDESVLDGARTSVELTRARDLRSTVDSVDFLLDLHSMASDFSPVILAGSKSKGRVLAERLGLGLPIVVDSGHQAGRRLRDYGAFDSEASEKTSLLIECGQHWLVSTLHTARKAAMAFLETTGLVSEKESRRKKAARITVRVTQTVTAQTNEFEFTERYQGLEVIGPQGTVVAKDGDKLILTPYENCVLVMPTFGVQSGQTAVRLGKLITR